MEVCLSSCSFLAFRHSPGSPWTEKNIQPLLIKVAPRPQLPENQAEKEAASIMRLHLKKSFLRSTTDCLGEKHCWERNMKLMFQDYLVIAEDLYSKKAG